MNDIRIAFLESAQVKLLAGDFAVLADVADFVRRFPADHEGLRFLGNALELQAFSEGVAAPERDALLQRAATQYDLVAALLPDDARSWIDIAQNLANRGLVDEARAVVRDKLLDADIDDEETAEERDLLVEALLGDDD